MSGAPVLVLRPEPGAGATAAKLTGMGIDPVTMPLFAIAPVAWSPPDVDRFDALALSSANAVRHGGGALSAFTALPVYAVGEATAKAARAAGFVVAGVGSGGIEGLAPLLERDGRRAILRLVGRDHIAFARPGMTVETIRVYAAREIAVDPARVEALPEGTIALLHSARAAMHFRELVDESGLPRAHFRIVALSPAVAAAAGGGWATCAIAKEAREASLLSALQNMLEAGPQAGRQGET